MAFPLRRAAAVAYRTAASMRQAMIPVATSWPRFSRPLLRMAGALLRPLLGHPASLSVVRSEARPKDGQTDRHLTEGARGDFRESGEDTHLMCMWSAR